MTLGMISWIQEEDFKRVKEKGLSFVELDVNDRAEEFLKHVDEIKGYSERYELPVQVNAAAAKLGCTIYITGCNYIEELSYYENCSLAISYFEKLIAYGKEKGVKIATYNCRWNNFVCDPMAFTIIHGY